MAEYVTRRFTEEIQNLRERVAKREAAARKLIPLRHDYMSVHRSGFLRKKHDQLIARSRFNPAEPALQRRERAGQVFDASSASRSQSHFHSHHRSEAGEIDGVFLQHQRWRTGGRNLRRFVMAVPRSSIARYRYVADEPLFGPPNESILVVAAVAFDSHMDEAVQAWENELEVADIEEREPAAVGGCQQQFAARP